MAKDWANIELIGREEVENLCKHTPDEIVRTALKPALALGAKPLVQAARQNLKRHFAVQTGALRASLGVKTKAYRRRYSAYAYIGARVEFRSKKFNLKEMKRIPANYLHLVEAGSRHSRPKPFLRPAFDEHRMTALHLIRGKLRTEIPKAARRAAKRKLRRYEAKIREE